MQDEEMEEVEKPKQTFWTPEEAKEFWTSKAEKKAEEEKKEFEKQKLGKNPLLCNPIH